MPIIASVIVAPISKRRRSQTTQGDNCQQKLPILIVHALLPLDSVSQRSARKGSIGGPYFAIDLSNLLHLHYLTVFGNLLSR